MVTGSGLLGGILNVDTTQSSGAFSAIVTVLGQAASNFDAELIASKTAIAGEFDAKLCVGIAATKVSPSALIVTPTAVNGSGVVPFTATYSASGWASGQKNIRDYTWYFHDINTVVSGGQTVEYTHNSSGSFLVTLKVTDDDGFVGFDSRRILTHSGIVLDLSELQISGVPQVGDAPLSINFGASGAAFGGGSILGFGWSFGHGLTSKRQNPSGIVYNTPGEYIPVCVMVDDRNVIISDSLNVGVNN